MLRRHLPSPCNSPKIYQNKSRAKNIFKSLFIVELNPSEIVPRPISQSPEKPIPTSESNRHPVSLFFLIPRVTPDQRVCSSGRGRRHETRQRDLSLFLPLSLFILLFLHFLFPFFFFSFPSSFLLFLPASLLSSLPRPPACCSAPRAPARHRPTRSMWPRRPPLPPVPPWRPSSREQSAHNAPPSPPAARARTAPCPRRARVPPT